MGRSANLIQDGEAMENTAKDIAQKGSGSLPAELFRHMPICNGVSLCSTGKIWKTVLQCEEFVECEADRMPTVFRRPSSSSRVIRYRPEEHETVRESGLCGNVKTARHACSRSPRAECGIVKRSLMVGAVVIAHCRSGTS